jgi:dienelactone hydrolase
LWYVSFPQLSDEEVRRTLHERWAEHDATGNAPVSGDPETRNHSWTRGPAVWRITEDEVLIRSGSIGLEGTLRLPGSADGLVAFAHGSGSTRFSARNRFVAEHLNEAGLATLLFDLLTEAEQAIDERTGELRFDIGLLSERLTGVLDWIETQPALREQPVGLFGASTGAAAALNAAAARPQRVAAVVSRGGRPDLALASLPGVRAPTLLIVGGLDDVVIGLNQQAAARLECEHRLEIVPGASHLFEESGKLEIVARLARDWFERHLRGAETRGRGPSSAAGHT